MHLTNMSIAGLGTATLLALLLAAPALAQTGTTTGTMGTTTPGVPNTGAGGDMTTTLVVLAVAALMVIVGAVYLARRDTSRDRTPQNPH